MKEIELTEALASNVYPGRGIVLGRSADGKRAMIAYFIMGRSENSRNRVFVPKGNDLFTEAADPSRMVDPSLIIYAPVRALENGVTVVTNGDQTDTVADFLRAGKTFEDALRTRTFEPDPPNYTPRISGMLTVADGAMAYKLSILKSDNGDASSALRYFFDYPQPKAGEGRLIHTYVTDGSPIPSFEGEPTRVRLPDASPDDLAAALWNALDAQNKVSLFVRSIDIATGETSTVILNQRTAANDRP